MQKYENYHLGGGTSHNKKGLPKIGGHLNG